jgi:hypothetical protein
MVGRPHRPFLRCVTRSSYKSKGDFYYRSPIKVEIVEWGEMKGAASIDNHVSVLRQTRRNGGRSYDKLDHQEQLEAYEKFLDRWGFAGLSNSGEFISFYRKTSL